MPRKKIILGFLVSILLLIACESEKRYPPKGYLPNTPKATEKLEVAYFWTPQDKLSSAYWKDANYVELNLVNLETGKLYPDGYLNMTGTYNGLSDFNKGNNPKATIKAGYDDEYLYILVEWKDTTANATYKTWLYQGPPDKHKTDSVNGWTSQGNTDQVSLIFNIDGLNNKDVWKWSLAYTAPFDAALNLTADENDNIIESSIPGVTRNAISDNSRIGPLFEWNGVRQEVNTFEGSIKLIDPSYYLLAEYADTMIGDVQAGQNIFNNVAECMYCHGENGDGESENSAGRLNIPKTNKYSRQGLIDYISGNGHEGSGSQYWGKIKNNPTDQDNLITFLRGIAGVPGYLLTSPETIDISAQCNISIGGIEKTNTSYKVLLKRKLIASTPEDVSFELNNSYTFSVRLSDNDEINYIGSQPIELIFKSNKL